MSNIDVKGLSKELEQAIVGLKNTSKLGDAGVVTRVSDGVIWVYGLHECGFGEVLEIKTDGETAQAFVLNLLEDEIGAVLLSGETDVKAGAIVSLSGKSL